MFLTVKFHQKDLKHIKFTVENFSSEVVEPNEREVFVKQMIMHPKYRTYEGQHIYTYNFCLIETVEPLVNYGHEIFLEEKLSDF